MMNGIGVASSLGISADHRRCEREFRGEPFPRMRPQDELLSSPRLGRTVIFLGSSHHIGIPRVIVVVTPRRVRYPYPSRDSSRRAPGKYLRTSGRPVLSFLPRCRGPLWEPPGRHRCRPSGRDETGQGDRGRTPTGVPSCEYMAGVLIRRPPCLALRLLPRGRALLVAQAAQSIHSELVWV